MSTHKQDRNTASMWGQATEPKSFCSKYCFTQTRPDTGPCDQGQATHRDRTARETALPHCGGQATHRETALPHCGGKTHTPFHECL